MRIGIDCRTILNPDAGEKAGVAHYTYHLVKTLLAQDKLDEFVLFFDHRARDIFRNFLEPNTIIRFFSYSKYKKYLPFVYSHILSASTLDAEKLQVYHSPANVVPLRYRGKYIVTVHDLAIYREPRVFPARQGFSIKYLVPKSVQRADRVIAVSNSTKKDIQEFFGVPEQKISVIYEGVDHARFSAPHDISKVREHLKNTYQITKDYILFVGTLEPRKNLIRLLEGFYQLVSRQPQIKKRYQLVLAGAKGWLYDEIFEEAKNRNLQDMVIFPGYLPIHDLPKLYQGATFFVYPSLYEGFGLPVLEAMAAGTPVITSNNSSLVELAGGACELVDPYDTEGMSRALQRLVEDVDYRRKLSKRGKARAREFSWEKCAQETLAVYRGVGEGG
ncbi:MAG: glycosyltransferase family 4 protein [Candidatus Doudnabacteria bacterium]|nr:glycosyltransferase family 4 protein [Candidatus Doudnabacteria bacterium]